VAFSPDGRDFAWGGATIVVNGMTPSIDRTSLQYQFRLAAGGAPLTDAVPAEEKPGKPPYLRAATVHGGWSLSAARDDDGNDSGSLRVSSKGRGQAFIKLGGARGHPRPYTFTGDGGSVVASSGGGVLAAYDLRGRKYGHFVGHEADVLALAASPDGRFLVSGSADGTVKLWNVKTRELIATLFATAEGEWIMWMPQGYYACSPGGDGMVGWLLNRGADKEAGFVTARQLRRRLNRPEVLARAMDLASAEAAIKELSVKEPLSQTFKLSDLESKPVPKMNIEAPAPGTAPQNGTAKIAVTLEPLPNSMKVVRLRVQVNGRHIAENLPRQGAAFESGTHIFDIPVAKGRNLVNVMAVNEMGETVASTALHNSGAGVLDARGTLYILAAGVDKYATLGDSCVERGTNAKKPCDVRYASADAVKFAETMKERIGPRYQKVVTQVLANSGSDSFLADLWHRWRSEGLQRSASTPTASNILSAFSVLRQTEANDTVLVYLAGQAINEGPVYNFLATDAAWGKGGLLQPATVVPWYTVEEAVEGAKGQRFLFLDTRHSANSYNQRLANDAFHSNVLAYSSARWDQLALDDDKRFGGHGLFAYALVEAINGAARDPNGEIRAEGLQEYVRDRVHTLALPYSRDQQPQYTRGQDAENFALRGVD
jgi:WD40 repeat protein/uncharacterized caspase-like protein